MSHNPSAFRTTPLGRFEVGPGGRQADFRLIIHEPGQTPTSFDLGQAEVSVGRSSAAMLRLRDGSVSREQGVLEADQGQWTFRPGRGVTAINGSPISDSAILHAGDTLQFGAVVVLFERAGRQRARAHKMGRYQLWDQNSTDTVELGALMQVRDATLAQHRAIVRWDDGRVKAPAADECLVLGGSDGLPVRGVLWPGAVAEVGLERSGHVLERVTRWATVRVNGRPVTKRRKLQAGDRIEVGNSTFLYSLI